MIKSGLQIHSIPNSLSKYILYDSTLQFIDLSPRKQEIKKLAIISAKFSELPFLPPSINSENAEFAFGDFNLGTIVSSPTELR